MLFKVQQRLGQTFAVQLTSCSYGILDHNLVAGAKMQLGDLVQTQSYDLYSTMMKCNIWQQGRTV